MAPQQKGKQGTKGAKQIVTDNISTLNYYRNMALAANAINLIGLSLFANITSLSSILLLIFSSAVYIGSYQFMKYIAKATYSETGQLLDSGADLNMEGAISEYPKDLIILTAGCQFLSLISTYFWFLWLLAPVRALWVLWVNVLKPASYSEPAPGEKEDAEKQDKKQKKMERKMRRMR